VKIMPKPIKADHEVEVARIPECQLCDDGTLADYDGRTKSGRWGYMCEAHMKSDGVGTGLGRGQRLIQAS
jgi:hypothetical protein